MIITDITLRKLSPSNGMRLTNGEVLADGDIYFDRNTIVDDWYEITEEEYQQKMAEREADPLGEEASP